MQRFINNHIYRITVTSPGHYIMHRMGCPGHDYAVTVDHCTCPAYRQDAARFGQAPKCKHVIAAREMASEQRMAILTAEFPEVFTHWTED